MPTLVPESLTLDPVVQPHLVGGTTSPGRLPARLLQVLHAQQDLLKGSVMLAACLIPLTAVRQKPET